jgi:hypothetical protein
MNEYIYIESYTASYLSLGELVGAVLGVLDQLLPRRTQHLS